MSMSRQLEKCLANQLTSKSLNAFIKLKGDNVAQISAQAANDCSPCEYESGGLHGKLIAVKDNICTTDLHTTCASKILHGFTSPYSATVVEKLQAAGAIITGKANMDEFGMGSHSTYSSFGPVHSIETEQNDHVSAGGSSGGSAVAVASGQCYAALGTDTGGSVRLPAAYTGIVGFKPSYGMISRYGVVAYANSLDTVGILAPNTSIARQVFNSINGYDGRDPTSLTLQTRARIKDLLGSSKLDRPLRIGVPAEYNIKEVDPNVRKVWLRSLQFLQSQGHLIYSVALPSTQMALSSYYVIAPAEASSNLAKFDGVRYGQQATESEQQNVLFANTRGQGFGEEVKRRILLGAYSLSASAIDNYFMQAQRVRRLVQKDFDSIFFLQNPLCDSPTPLEQPHETQSIGVDILISPTAPSLAPRLINLEGRSHVDTYSDDVMTVPASLAGLPAISIPFRLRDDRTGNPMSNEGAVGIQIMAQYGHDDMVLHAAEVLEFGRSDI